MPKVSVYTTQELLKNELPVKLKSFLFLKDFFYISCHCTRVFCYACLFNSPLIRGGVAFDSYVRSDPIPKPPENECTETQTKKGRKSLLGIRCEILKQTLRVNHFRIFVNSQFLMFCFRCNETN